MNKPGLDDWGWALAACVFIVAAAALLPLVSRSTNCGGNTAALNACRLVVRMFETVAMDRDEKPFRIADLTAPERENFRNTPLPAGRLLVLSEPVLIGEQEPKKIIAACDAAFDNVPRRWIGRAPMAHAVAYSDGSVGLIAVAEFRHLDLSSFVDATTISQSSTNHAGATELSQPPAPQANSTPMPVGSGR